MRASLVLLCALLCRAEDLPLTGISHVAFRVSNLDQARQFYTVLMGYPEAFQMKNKEGGIGIAFLKINDEQYIEVQPTLKEGENLRMTHVSIVTSDIEKLHRMLTERGLQPTALRPPGGDGNRAFRLIDPDGNPLEFTQYLPGSLHSEARGKFADTKRISKHLRHAGISVKQLEPALSFYRDKLGFVETWRGGPKDGELRWVNLQMPGPGKDYVELMIQDATPTREQMGSMGHICLEVASVPASFVELQKRGLNTERSQPRVGRNGRRQLNLFDPDGSRTELMEPGLAQ